jgi:hypothetical protein
MRSFSLNSMAASLFSQTRRGFLLSAFNQPLSIGGIRFEVEKNGVSKRRYLHIHGNETTAREVLREHAKSHKGIYCFVVSDKRNVLVGDCLIDPNRMFTEAGARKSLERWNQGKSAAQIDASLALLAKDRDAFVKALTPPRGGLLIAMHNNSEGYSIKDEVSISDRVHMPEEANPRDFMLVTNERDFEIIAKGPYNACLQKTVRTDDGSFSVLANSRAIRYVNIEAALGSYAKQKSMIAFLDQVLR